ncbi:MAG TPA: hypothetical protein VFD30_17925 [Terriglobia bacterium]|nr:hypothetical protein [Terriglobia bacterium]
MLIIGGGACYFSGRGSRTTQGPDPSITVPEHSQSSDSSGLPSPPETGQTGRMVNQDNIRQALAEGKVLHDRGEYDAEIAEYETALLDDPTNTELHRKIEVARKAKAAEERRR